ncbi:MAG: hypothetical protein Tsb0032_38010 [Kiloniellaceae bacterium]
MPSKAVVPGLDPGTHCQSCIALPCDFVFSVTSATLRNAGTVLPADRALGPGIKCRDDSLWGGQGRAIPAGQT